MIERKKESGDLLDVKRDLSTQPDDVQIIGSSSPLDRASVDSKIEKLDLFKRAVVKKVKKTKESVPVKKAEAPSLSPCGRFEFSVNAKGQMTFRQKPVLNKLDEAKDAIFTTKEEFQEFLDQLNSAKFRGIYHSCGYMVRYT